MVMYQRRGFVLFAVLVIILSSLLIVTSLLHMSQGEAAGAAHTRESTIERTIAWSGIQAIVAEMYRQRDDLLRGELPQLDGEYVLYEHANRMGVVRVLPVGPARERYVAESAKIDVNIATEEMLAAFDDIDEALARRIVRYRDNTLRRPFQSIAELLRVDGITPELLYGPLEDIHYRRDARGEELDLAERVQMRLGGAEPRGLADLLTVYGFEPALQRNGRLRINLNVSWSDELQHRIADRFDPDTATIVAALFEQVNFDSEAALYQVFGQFDVAPEDWPDAVDTFTADAGEFHFGRVNINHASAPVLAALPGIDADIAEQIVAVRERVPDERKETVAWCAMEGLLDAEAYQELAEFITVRSWTFRLRLAVGEIRTDADDDEAWEHMTIVEVVLDMAGAEPRVAYLRDVTLFDTATALMAARLREEAAQPELMVERAASGLQPAASLRRTPIARAQSAPARPAEPMVQPDESLMVEDDDDDVDMTAATGGGQRQRIGRWIPGQ